MIYKAAGSPQMEGNGSGTCRACGASGAGLPFDIWDRETFTGRDSLSPGDIVCYACQFCFDEHSAILAERVGKDKLQKMRNYSHFVLDGQWVPLSKANKHKMRELLPKAHVAIIALSGQKHIIFRARPGWWQIEEHAIWPFDIESTIRLIEPLYNGGFSKDEIETGRYFQKRILDFGFGEWRTIEDAVRPIRGTMRLQLALFLVQKENDG